VLSCNKESGERIIEFDPCKMTYFAASSGAYDKLRVLHGTLTYVINTINDLERGNSEIQATFNYCMQFKT
jgi:hypothetical protein